MKKVLYTIGIMMFLTAAASPFYASGQEFSGKEEDVPYSTARIASKIESAIGLDPAANWFNVFGEQDDSKVGQDLYMVIYEKTQDQPEKQADKNIAGKYGMSEADLVRILNGDYTNLVEKKKGMTQEEAMKKIAEIQQVFAEEKDLLQLQANIKAAVEPSEIFANGNINDSGFDLINDLQIIENLLFLKSDPIDVGGDFSAPGAGGGGEAGAGAGAGATPPAAQGGGAGTGAGAGAGAGNAGGKGGTVYSGKVNQPVSTGAGVQAVAPGAAQKQVNPDSCFAGNKYDKALTDFDTRKQTDSNLKDNSQGQVMSGTLPAGGTTGGAAGGAANTPATGGATSGTGNQAAANTSDFLPPTPESTTPVEPAPAGQWLKDKLCAGPFCIDVKFITKPATSAYQNADNCIACHAEKINDTLKKVINHTLVPSKAPGNLGESAECKKAIGTAFGSISMNFYAIAMPVQTPINDDLVYGKTIEDDWYSYCNAVAFPFSCRKKDPPANQDQATYESTYVIPPSIIDTVTKKETTNASDTTTTDDIAKRIATAAAQMAAQKVQNTQTYKISQGADQSIGFYDPLTVELQQMIYYFANIRDLLHSLHEDVDTIPGSHACTVLREKKECT